MTRRIGLLGATGYTGRLVARELHRRAFDAVLGGRNPERLQAVSEFGETFVVDTSDPAQLHDFLGRVDAVVSCVGPFEQLGRPVVAAAVEAGVPYVDSTGEPGFIAHVYATYAGAATPVVPACGFDYIPGDFAVALAAEALGTAPTEVLVGYDMRGTKPSRGTARSALGAIATVAAEPRRVELPYPGGNRTGVVVPWGEQLTVPRHLPGAQVASAVVVKPSWLANAAPALRAGQKLMPLIAPLLDKLVDRMPEGPDDAARDKARTDLLAVVSAEGRSASVQMSCRDVYGSTARFLVEAAVRVGDAEPGALAPSQAFDPREFLAACAGDLLRWQVVPTS